MKNHFQRLVRPGQRVLSQASLDGSESLYLLSSTDAPAQHTLFFSGRPTAARKVEAVAREAAQRAQATGVPVVFNF